MIIRRELNQRESAEFEERFAHEHGRKAKGAKNSTGENYDQKEMAKLKEFERDVATIVRVEV